MLAGVEPEQGGPKARFDEKSASPSETAAYAEVRVVSRRMIRRTSRYEINVGVLQRVDEFVKEDGCSDRVLVGGLAVIDHE